MKKFENIALSDRAYNAILNSLQNGELEPLRPMIIRNLALEYGISTTPIREALQRLVAERLLIMQPNRSIVVPQMTRSHFLDLMPVRTSLEGLATRFATPNFNTSDLEYLAELVKNASKTAENYDAKTYLAINREFHFYIYDKSHNLELMQLIKYLWVKVGPTFTRLFDDDYYRRHANDKHSSILSALRKGDAAEAQYFMEQDISIAAEALLALMAERAEL